ncbi:RnfABCDGE type electron transport complex subunit D, partial [bacterium]|nr:RnfABCDGE type electron transport complex subunit D [bacterium]
MSFQNSFKVTFSPHIHSGNSAFKMYFAGVLSLLPAVFAVAYFFGLSGVLLLATTVSGSYLTDFSVNFLAYKKFNFKDTSAIFTGLLLAFFLPPTCPLWIAFAGAVFSILVAKIPFGGTGS